MNRESERKRLVEQISECCAKNLNVVQLLEFEKLLLADHLLDDGWMRPPVKVGQTVYLIKDGFIERCEVEGIHYTRRSNYVRIRPFHQEYLGNWSVYYKPSIRSFGKTLFTSREDAVKALEGNVPDTNVGKKGGADK